MTSRVIRRNSIRRRLLLFLIPSLLLLVVGAAALTYYVALHVATFAYDRSLLDPALDMAANVRMEPEGPRLAMLKQAQEALLYDHEDTLVFQIRDAAGDLIAEAEREGALHVLRKPVALPTLMEMLDSSTDTRRVLVVDDEPGFLRTLGDVLRHHGYVVFEAQSLAQAVTQLERASPGAVILDLRLDNDDGDVADQQRPLRLIKQLDRTRAVEDRPAVPEKTRAGDVELGRHLAGARFR